MNYLNKLKFYYAIGLFMMMALFVIAQSNTEYDTNTICSVSSNSDLNTGYCKDNEDEVPGTHCQKYYVNNSNPCMGTITIRIPKPPTDSIPPLL
jgi:hypothetical protein